MLLDQAHRPIGHGGIADRPRAQETRRRAIMLEGHVGFKARHPDAVLPVVPDLTAPQRAQVPGGEARRGQRVSEAVAQEHIGVEPAAAITDLSAHVEAGPGPYRFGWSLRYPRHVDCRRLGRLVDRCARPKLLRQAEVEAPARPVLRGEHAHPGPVPDHVARIEEIDDVEAQRNRRPPGDLIFARDPGIDLHIGRIVIGVLEARAQAAAVDQIGAQPGAVPQIGNAGGSGPDLRMVRENPVVVGICVASRIE